MSNTLRTIQVLAAILLLLFVGFAVQHAKQRAHQLPPNVSQRP